MADKFEPEEVARRNVRSFILFRMFFTARFYYPVFALIFLDYGLTLEQFGILNGIWAITIVLLEVPSGALADTLGRRRLLIVAGICVVLEMLALLAAPINGGNITFTLFVIDRILSGIAEAAASGADEALAYDSLKDAGRESEWSRVLERLQRLTSLAFFVAMLTGAAVYDATMVNAVLKFFGADFSVQSEQLIKAPIFLTFCSSLVVFTMAVRMHETPSQTNDTVVGKTLLKTWKQTLSASKWIWMNAFAFGVILATMVLDNAVRQFLTLASEYWNVIKLPVASYGLIGSGMALMGIFVPKLAKLFSDKFKPLTNFLFVCSLILIGFWGLSWAIPYWGILPAILLYAGMQITSFLVSRYLNEVAPSEQRATVLSLKGFSTNLIYGAVSFLYGGLIAHIRSGYSPEDASSEVVKDAIFIESLQWFPWYFLLTVVVFFILNQARAIFFK